STRDWSSDVCSSDLDLAASLHFAPTRRSAENLRQEGIPEHQIHVTGNTVVDALSWMAAADAAPPEGTRLVLVTSHRRESFGEPKIGRASCRERHGPE